MFYYQFKIQFVRAESPCFSEEWVKTLIEKSKKNYNSRSLIAANPKQILECEPDPEDDRTLNIILESKAELEESKASKALRVFSTYLISGDKEKSLSEYVLGKRLFKMLAVKMESQVPSDHEKDETSKGDSDDLRAEEDLLMLEKLFLLLKDARKNENSRIKVSRIKDILNSLED